MSFFNFRRAGAASAAGAASNAQTENVETIRKRAKHRLIGSAVLVLAGIIGFPLLFDTQPRPIAMDIPIEIPSRNKVAPPASPNAASATVLAAVGPSTPLPSAQPALPAASVPVVSPKPAQLAASDKVAAAASLDAKEEIIADKKPVAPVVPPQAAIKIESKPAPKFEAKVEAKVDPKPAAKTAEPAPQDDGARARALLEGRSSPPVSVAKPAAIDSAAAASPAAAGTEMRLIVQVGAFADVEKAREVRMKLEKAGFKTYTQVAETTAGKRIRVRVGPFATKAEADKAASKIKRLDLQASILTL